MKKSHGIEKEIKKLRIHLSHLQENSKKASLHLLMNEEALIRKKIKILKQLPDMEEYGGEILYNDYVLLLNDISRKILSHYNEENQTDYNFEDLTSSYKEAFINSGILCVLQGIYLPRLMNHDFQCYLPINPKDEYKKTRQMKRKFYLHLGETNTGKTYHAIEALKKSKRGIYLAPLRLLALENYENLNQSQIPCHLLTGEEEIIVTNANHISCTIEKLDLNQLYDVAVIDEVQLIGDVIRGASWTKAILGLMSQDIHICGALNTKKLLIQLIEDCGEEYEIKEYYRNTPLKLEQTPYQMNNPSAGDALIAFSKKKVLELSRYYQDRGYKVSVIYGDLPPEVRRLQYSMFSSGESELLITTDAIGMGVNLPIKRIVFTSLKKFDGEDIRELTSQEVKQIAGRAGRKGIYEVGYVTSIDEYLGRLQEKLECEDRLIEKAIIGPTELLLQIKGIPLIEKLAIWSMYYDEFSYYQKMDVSHYLFILEQIKPYKLSQNDQWKVMKLPINFTNPELLNLLLFFIEEVFVDGNFELTKPKIHSEDLDLLEIHYQEVNLYYNFSKSFNLIFDVNWVYQERAKISKKLNYLLHCL